MLRFLFSFALVASACAPAPLVRSVIVPNTHDPTRGDSQWTGSDCAPVCPARRAGEQLLWCHQANMDTDKVNPTTTLKENMGVLVCNYGAN